MRGLCRLAAGLLSLACASTTFVIPADDAVDRLQDALPDTLLADQAPPLDNDDAGLEVEKLDLSHANLAAHNVPADENQDAILMQHWRTWLDTLETDQPSTASTSFLSDIPTATLSAAFDILADTTEGVSSVLPSTPTRLSAPPEPTSPVWFPRANSQQRPLGEWGETWRAAKHKVQSVVALVASHITDCPSKATKTASAPESPSAISSTITARTLEQSATSAPEPVVETSGKESQQDDKFASAAAASLPTAHVSQPYPAHATGSTFVSATSTPSPTPAVDDTSFDATVAASNQSIFPSIPQASTDVKYIAAIAIPVFLTIVLSCVIFGILIRRNPRRRAEHAARCEERKNLRLYRRAACRHKMETLVVQIGSYPPFKWFARKATDDLAEKGLLESTPEQGAAVTRVPNSRVSQEIASFREAHAFVDSLVHAEEGGSWSSRDRRRTVLWLFGGRARRQRAMSNASSDLSDSEKSAPPPYDERSNYEKVEPATYARRVQIVNREDAQDSDKSSVSSIIPTSPRHSTYTFSTGDPDSDKE